MLEPVIIIAAACAALGLCWHLANGGSLVPFRSERQHWQRMSEEAKTKPRTEPVREASPVQRVEPAPEPWQTADDLMDNARDQVDRDLNLLRAGVDWMMGQLGRDRTQR